MSQVLSMFSIHIFYFQVSFASYELVSHALVLLGILKTSFISKMMKYY